MLAITLFLFSGDAKGQHKRQKGTSSKAHVRTPEVRFTELADSIASAIIAKDWQRLERYLGKGRGAALSHSLNNLAAYTSVDLIRDLHRKYRGKEYRLPWTFQVVSDPRYPEWHLLLVTDEAAYYDPRMWPNGFPSVQIARDFGLYTDFYRLDFLMSGDKFELKELHHWDNSPEWGE